MKSRIAHPCSTVSLHLFGACVTAALVGTLRPASATEGGPNTYGRHPVKMTLPGSLRGFLENGEVIITARDSSLQYWDVSGGELRDSVNMGIGVEQSVLSPDGANLALVKTYEKSPENWLFKVLLVNVASGDLVETDGTTNWRGTLAFSPDGTTLAHRTPDEIHLFEVATGRIQDVLPDSTWQGSWPSDGMAFSSDGSLLASIYRNGDSGIHLWDLDSGRLSATIPIEYPPHDLAFSSDGLWDVASGQRLSSFAFGFGYRETVAYSPDGETLAACDWFEVALWDKDGRWKALLTSGASGYRNVTYSPDGSLLASTTDGYPGPRVLIWDLRAYPPHSPVRGEVVLVDSLGNPIPDMELSLAHDEFYSWITETDSEGRAPLWVYRDGYHGVRTHYEWPGLEEYLYAYWPQTRWSYIPLLRDRRFILTLTLVGGVAPVGDSSPGNFTTPDRLRPWDIAGLPVHRIEVEVRVPDHTDHREGDHVRMARSISGQLDRHTWIAELDSTGSAQLPIATTSRSTGFYQAEFRGYREGSGSDLLGSWNSIPLNEGRRYILELPPGRPARLTSLRGDEDSHSSLFREESRPERPEPFQRDNADPVSPGRAWPRAAGDLHVLESGGECAFRRWNAVAHDLCQESSTTSRAATQDLKSVPLLMARPS